MGQTLLQKFPLLQQKQEIGELNSWLLPGQDKALPSLLLCGRLSSPVKAMDFQGHAAAGAPLAVSIPGDLQGALRSPFP